MCSSDLKEKLFCFAKHMILHYHKDCLSKQNRARPTLPNNISFGRAPFDKLRAKEVPSEVEGRLFVGLPDTKTPCPLASKRPLNLLAGQSQGVI